MKIELTREDLKSAIRCFVENQGIDLSERELDIKVSKTGITTATITNVKKQAVISYPPKENMDKNQDAPNIKPEVEPFEEPMS
jgi:hypothetical protein